MDPDHGAVHFDAPRPAPGRDAARQSEVALFLPAIEHVKRGEAEPAHGGAVQRETDRSAEQGPHLEGAREPAETDPASARPTAFAPRRRPAPLAASAKPAPAHNAYRRSRPAGPRTDRP